jgi:hypothetical protein
MIVRIISIMKRFLVAPDFEQKHGGVKSNAKNLSFVSVAHRSNDYQTQTTKHSAKRELLARYGTQHVGIGEELPTTIDDEPVGGSDDIHSSGSAAPPLRTLIDESLLYTRLIQLTGIDFGPLEEFKASVVSQVVFFVCSRQPVTLRSLTRCGCF